jgi:peptide/nickel transport system permease protein
MTRYLARRLLFSVVVLWVVSIATFAIIHLAPGGPGVLLSPDLSPEEAAQFRRNLGLDDPLPVQYLRWVGALVRGDLGRSLTHGAPVSAMITERLPATLLLAGAAFGLTLVVGIPAGIISAKRRDSVFDYLSTSVAFLGVAMPPFWLGIMLILLFSVSLKLLPSSGMYTLGGDTSLVDLLTHLVMPAVVLGMFSMAEVTRYTRSAILTVLHQDYVRTARAKGLGEMAVLVTHALRNALIPVVTVLGSLIPRFLGGAPVTETVFGWPGMGRLAVDAARLRDYPLVMGITLMISLVVVLTNLAVDILYKYIDPRVEVG